MDPLTALELKKLTVEEILDALGPTVYLLSSVRQCKPRLIEAALSCDQSVQDRLRAALAHKLGVRTIRRQEVQERQREAARARRVEERLRRQHQVEDEERGDIGQFLDVPTRPELEKIFESFYHATGGKALALAICGVCARKLLVSEVFMKKIPLSQLPNSHCLRPRVPHPAHELIDGLLIEKAGCYDDPERIVQICRQCLSSLQRRTNKPPMLSLANSLWIGPVPLELQVLTLPE